MTKQQFKEWLKEFGEGILNSWDHSDINTFEDFLEVATEESFMRRRILKDSGMTYEEIKQNEEEEVREYKREQLKKKNLKKIKV